MAALGAGEKGSEHEPLAGWSREEAGMALRKAGLEGRDLCAALSGEAGGWLPRGGMTTFQVPRFRNLRSASSRFTQIPRLQVFLGPGSW